LKDKKKKRRYFPILRAVDIFHWISVGIFPFEQVGDSTIISLTAGKTVRQTWLHRTKGGRIIKKSYSRYLKKGIFLSPVWKRVHDWETQFYKENGIALDSIGIFFFRDHYSRLCYNRVNSLDAAQRQQGHIAEWYLTGTKFQVSEFTDMAAIIDKVTNIVAISEDRQIELTSLQLFLEHRLEGHRRRLQSFVDHSPFFQGKQTEMAKGAIGNSLLQIAADINQFNFRNAYPRLKVANRALKKAYGNMYAGHYDSAKVLILGAIKYMIYPDPTPG